MRLPSDELSWRRQAKPEEVDKGDAMKRRRKREVCGKRSAPTETIKLSSTQSGQLNSLPQQLNYQPQNLASTCRRKSTTTAAITRTTFWRKNKTEEENDREKFCDEDKMLKLRPFSCCRRQPQPSAVVGSGDGKSGHCFRFSSSLLVPRFRDRSRLMATCWLTTLLLATTSCLLLASAADPQVQKQQPQQPVISPSELKSADSAAKTTDADQEKQEQLANRFKYHLNHLRPPSLVPITIQQAAPATAELSARHSASGQRLRRQQLSYLEPAAWAQEQAAPTGDRQPASAADEGSRLLQLQLPLQLHLKLRPLPLPMPPPPALQRRTGSGDTNELEPAAEVRANAEPEVGAAEKRRRSLEIAAPARTGSGGDPFQNAWREAKRVLLLNSMVSPALSYQRSRLERRSMAAQTPAGNELSNDSSELHPVSSAASPNYDATTSSSSVAPPVAVTQQPLATGGWLQVTGAGGQTGTRAPKRQPAAATIEPDGRMQKKSKKPPSSHPLASAGSQGKDAAKLITSRQDNSNSHHHDEEGESNKQVAKGAASKGKGGEFRQAPKLQPQLKLLQLNDSSSVSKGEVRRQRHSAQQLQGDSHSPTDPEMDSRIQSMAAAMLPLFWPSFQLSSLQRAPWTPLTTEKDTANQRPQREAASAIAQTGSWPMNYTQLSRNEFSEAMSPASATTRSTLFNELIPTTTMAPRTAATSSYPMVMSGRQILRQETTNAMHRTTLIGPSDYHERPEVARSERRRTPSYLLQSASSSTPYPDSTRLASKYPMPRIKFAAAPSEKPIGRRPEEEPVAHLKPLISSTGKKQQQLPALISLPQSLSKLIEQQLAANASRLLQSVSHKAPTGIKAQGASKLNSDHLSSMSQAANQLPAPTTSVSKVIRPAQQLQRLQQQVKLTTPKASTSGSSILLAREAKQLQRMTTTRTPEVTSVSMRSTTSMVSTTTTTTLRPPPSTTTTPAPTTRRSAEVATTTTTTSTTTTTTTTTARPTEESAVSNGVLPEEEDEEEEDAEEEKEEAKRVVEPKRKQKPVAGAKRRRPPPPPLAGPGAGSNSSSRKGIKLFHFKRKPDVKKLPFFKKPLNYTELGWTNEQIREHLEATSGSEEADAGADPEETRDQALGDGSRQKRKRRGKNHFERLMAELHSNQQQESTGSSEPEQSAPPQAQTVPVIKKKSEESSSSRPSVFMSQKARQQRGGNSTTGSGTIPADQPAASGESREPQVAAGNSSSGASGRPMVRMRRKHHGEQPTGHELWRPSRPLLLVPSGLLTPSGHQLVPVLMSDAPMGPEERQRLADDLLGWRPARHQQPAPEQQAKPSGGLAPSGEESFLLAPPNAAVAQQQPKQQPAATGATGELRVPRLLVKPMRPAKYSLNGYIPRPTLSQLAAVAQPQPSNQQQPAKSPSSPLPVPHSTGSNGPSGSNRRPADQTIAAASQSASLVVAGGKDLDSSTSNEVFSRRRGLQQRIMRSAAAALATAEAKLSRRQSQVAATVNAEETTNNSNSRQLEENRRKYMMKSAAEQKLSRTPTLSAQRVNLIKAKLGLSVAPAASQQATAQTSLVAATNEPLAVGIPAAEVNALVPPPAALPASQPLIGAPLSSIPKTDFECTDSKGRFVAGIFADHKTNCQVWHLCSNNRKYSFLCPSGTIFNAKFRICDWKYNSKCENTLPH